MKSMDSTENERLDKLFQKTPASYEEAVAIQKELRKMVIPRNGFKEINRVAGADLAPIKDEEKLVCGIIVFSYPGLEEIERVSAVVVEQFPYIPGLLAFREGPAIIEAFKKLKNKPDILMVDGQGIAHPRGFGIACHVGVFLDIPTVGVAKQRLYGKYNEPKDSEGNWTPLTAPYEGNTIGAVLRTKKKTKPVFVSIGHKIDLRTAVKLSLQCSKGYRIPEPTRQADIFVARLKTIDP